MVVCFVLVLWLSKTSSPIDAEAGGDDMKDIDDIYDMDNYDSDAEQGELENNCCFMLNQELIAMQASHKLTFIRPFLICHWSAN